MTIEKIGWCPYPKNPNYISNRSMGWFESEEDTETLWIKDFVGYHIKTKTIIVPSVMYGWDLRWVGHEMRWWWGLAENEALCVGFIWIRCLF